MTKGKQMKVFSLVGCYDYEGSTLLGVFGSLGDLKEFVAKEILRRHAAGRWLRADRLGYDQLGYVESELGQEIDQDEMIEYFN